MTMVKKVTNLARQAQVEKTFSIIGIGANGLKTLAPKAVFVKRPNVSDLNDATCTGYYILNTSGIKNVPEPGISYGVLMVFEDDTAIDEAEFVQILVSLIPCAMYIRKKGSQSGWGSWNKVNTTELTT